MKKLVSLLLCLLFLSATAFAEEGWFAEAELNADERKLLQLLNKDEDIGPYEFIAPEGATHLTLTVLTLSDGQWVNFCDLHKELTSPSVQPGVTFTASPREDGSWDVQVHEQRASDDRPDGRIFIDGTGLPDNIWLLIDQPDDEYPTSVGAYNEQDFDPNGLYLSRRTFLHPEQQGHLQQKVSAALNEPVLLDIYVCCTDGSRRPPDFSAFDNPAAFAGLDHVFAVTATFTDEPLE